MAKAKQYGGVSMAAMSVAKSENKRTAAATPSRAGNSKNQRRQSMAVAKRRQNVAKKEIRHQAIMIQAAMAAAKHEAQQPISEKITA